MDEKIQFSIRKMAIDDVKEVLSIENDSIISPWNEKQIQYELLNNPVSRIRVAVDDKMAVIGFIDYWITYDSATIAQIAIKVEERRKGVAKVLLENMIEDCKDHRVKAITLEVRCNNEPAIKLYEAYGFKRVVIKKSYYHDGTDAIYMVREVY